jgi:hypothetical protein
VLFLSDVSDASFSKLKGYIQNELTNPTSQQTVQQPAFNPIGIAKRKVAQVTTLAGIGTAKYIKDNKLNRRQKKQVDKWQNFFNPKPKKQWFPNPFRKKPLTTPTQPNGAIK